MRAFPQNEKSSWSGLIYTTARAKQTISLHGPASFQRIKCLNTYQEYKII